MRAGSDQARLNAGRLAWPCMLAGAPRSVANESVEEHALEFRIGHRRGRPLLAKQRRGHPDVCEVRGMARLVHERGQSGETRADGGRVSE